MYRRSYHPVMLRTIKHILDYAFDFNKPVSICGEAALDPVTLPLLVGLRCRSLTVSPAMLPTIRRRIASLNYVEIGELARQAICLKRAEEVYSLLSETLGISN
jgi:phosphoenolpyruvate-protein kinase (PTS system EI component)